MTIKRNPYRQQRIANLLRDTIAEVLTGEFTDHYLNGEIVSITDVKLSPDLRIATCYIMPINLEQQALVSLRKHGNLLRQQVTERLNLKYSPELRFLLDPGFINLQEVNTLIDHVSTPDH